MTPLEKRVKAVEAVMHEWQSRSFDMPRNDCVKLLLFHLRQLDLKLEKASKLIGYKNPLQARATLRRVYQVDNVTAMMDKFYSRIPAAAALPGDVIAAPGSESTLGAIAIYVGNNLIYGYVDGHDCPVVGRLEHDVDLPVTAWRLPV